MVGSAQAGVKTARQPTTAGRGALRRDALHPCTNLGAVVVVEVSPSSSGRLGGTEAKRAESHCHVSFSFNLSPSLF
ncbi:hypothetical protein X777_14383 [Ooceraea biroi]|uniref:Uncharacterized protein n=1 Tax=Ooceraea biroi TaxID=2015173 RepID=A0A026WVV3_OOCBI|nr:hypothetical protein X777_14383 [Ooceraea biroi]